MSRDGTWRDRALIFEKYWPPRIVPLTEEERDIAIPHHLRAAAVGRVVAGIVHDANNALAVVVWNLDRATHALPAASKEADSAKTAAKAAMKAAALLQRVLSYAGKASYDADLTSLAELLSRLFVTASATVEADIAVDCRIDDSVGPVIVDEMLLELSLLDLVVVLSGRMNPGGSIVVTAADAPNARILLSLRCAGLAAGRVPSLEATLLGRFAGLAGGELSLADNADGCEIRLSLPRATESSTDGTAFA